MESFTKMSISAEIHRVVLTITLAMLLGSDGNAFEFSDKCGETFVIGGSGGYVYSQLDDIDCTVTLATSTDRKILFDFTSLNIQGDPSDCKKSDYVEVFDGTTKSISLGVFCGLDSNSYDAITSTTNAITIHVKIGLDVTNKRFQMAYNSFSESSITPCTDEEFECSNGRCISSLLRSDTTDNCGDGSDEPSDLDFELANNCGETVDIGGSGDRIVSQVSYLYADGLDCAVTLTTSVERKIFAVITFIEIEGDPSDCKQSDYVEVFDGTTSLGVFCGMNYRNYEAITSTSNTITIQFKTDLTGSAQGFVMTYNSFSESSITPCTDDEFECGNGRCIDKSLRLDRFDNCDDESDEQLRDPGFEHFTDRCGGTVDIGVSGNNIESQATFNYVNDLDCSVTLTTSFDRKILVQFNFISIKGDQSDCKKSDYVEVFDGATKSTSLGVVCTRDSNSYDAITSTTNSITIQFKTDFNVSDNGFSMTYNSFSESSITSCTDDEFECDNGRCIDISLKSDTYDNCGDASDESVDLSDSDFEYFTDKCGKLVDIEGSGKHIDSQSDLNYANDLDCSVILATSSGRKIFVDFTSLNIQGDPSDCKKSDYVEVFDGTTNEFSLGVFCGTETNYDAITSTTNTMTIQFKTDSDVSATGFYMTYNSYSNSPCTDDEFKCNNGRCIDKSLSSDLYDNCGDESDIGDSIVGIIQWGIGILIAIIIGVIVAIVLCCVCVGCLCYHFCCKNRQHQQYTGVKQPTGHPAYNQQPPMAMQPAGQQI